MIPGVIPDVIPGVVLAGGQGLRLGGGDKALRVVGGRTVLAWIMARLAPQCSPLAINANGDPARFAATGLTVIADGTPGHLGPLAGVLAALDWAADQGAAAVLTVPGDAPFIPADLVARLLAARAEDGLAYARSGGRTHPLAAIWPVAIRTALRRALLEEDLRKVGAFTARFDCAVADWPTEPFDPFLNINTPTDLAEAERYSSIA